MKININTNPYDEPADLYCKDSISLTPGVTVLTGCNGSGKSTMLRMIQTRLKKDQSTSCYMYNQLAEGGKTARNKAVWQEDYGLFSGLWTASEGESIVINVGTVMGSIGRFVVENKGKDLYILFDAVDSGLSINNIRELKAAFQFILKDMQDSENDVYIVVSANTFEMCVDERCLDVRSCEYVDFENDYKKYTDYIMESAERKNERLSATANPDSTAVGKNNEDDWRRTRH